MLTPTLSFRRFTDLINHITTQQTSKVHKNLFCVMICLTLLKAGISTLQVNVLIILPPKIPTKTQANLR